jgi:hypothetical protein
MALQNKLKAFVRFDGSGRVIPSSLILQKSKPKVGNWKEIDANECCNYTTTTTTTAAPTTTTSTTVALTTTTTTTGVPVPICDTYFNTTGSPFATISYTDCNGVEVVNAQVNIITSVCVTPGTVTGEVEAFEVYPNTCNP